MAAPKFTAETRAAIIANVRAGSSFADGCRAGGVRLKTAEGWLARGRREPRGLYAEFAAAISTARGALENAALDRPAFERALAKAIRAGSVQAMKLWWDIHGQREESDAETDPFDDLESDELAQRRERAA